MEAVYFKDSGETWFMSGTMELFSVDYSPREIFQDVELYRHVMIRLVLGYGVLGAEIGLIRCLNECEVF